MKIFIDPLGDILYKSFYIYGLIQLFGNKPIHYSDAPFKDIPPHIRAGKSMNFVVQNGISEKKYTIACDDSYKIIPELYAWCDVYGSVNANFSLIPSIFQDKLVSLCPSFAIQYANPARMILDCIQNTPSLSNITAIKKHMGKYKRLLQRHSYSDYTQLPNAQSRYLFHCSTLWYNDEWNRNDETVNLYRAHFIRACQNNSDIQFEGGLVSQGVARSSEKKFEDCLCRRYSMNEWLDKTRQSAFVFNTPAFWNCHGWKLGEYMAMGKSILSTPLSNDLPKPLVAGIHYHETDSSFESISESINFLISHPDYCEKLSLNIQQYWEQYGTPTKSLQLLGIKNNENNTFPHK